MKQHSHSRQKPSEIRTWQLRTWEWMKETSFLKRNAFLKDGATSSPKAADFGSCFTEKNMGANHLKSILGNILLSTFRGTLPEFLVGNSVTGETPPLMKNLPTFFRVFLLETVASLFELAALYYQPKHCTVMREIPQIYHRLGLIDPPKKNGNLMVGENHQ